VTGIAGVANALHGWTGIEEGVIEVSSKITLTWTTNPVILVVLVRREIIILLLELE
jgi:hypothetical protein